MCTAAEILEKYNINDDIPISLSKLLEQLNIKAYARDFSDIDDGNEIAGFIKIEGKDKTTILVNAADSFTRQRFTVAHELAHYFLHMSNLEEGTHIELRGKSRNKKELEADKFAAELLMPENLVKKEYDKMNFPLASDLANIFKVSFSAMRYRLNVLGLWYYD